MAKKKNPQITLSAKDRNTISDAIFAHVEEQRLIATRAMKDEIKAGRIGSAIEEGNIALQMESFAGTFSIEELKIDWQEPEGD